MANGVKALNSKKIGTIVLVIVATVMVIGFAIYSVMALMKSSNNAAKIENEKSVAVDGEKEPTENIAKDSQKESKNYTNQNDQQGVGQSTGSKPATSNNQQGAKQNSAQKKAAQKATNMPATGPTDVVLTAFLMGISAYLAVNLYQKRNA